MGCLWSSQGGRERCMLCGRKEVNNLVIIDHVCEVCIAQGRQDVRRQAPSSGPCYGEFRCPGCGHKWKSNQARPGYGLSCKKCRGEYVKPHYTRPLTAADWADAKNVEQHRKDLCELCQKVGNCAKLKGLPLILHNYPNKRAKPIKEKKPISVWRKPYYASGRSHPRRRKPSTQASSWTKRNRKWH